jgi:murein DD-endopeptidase MepM/ murein hydrolase activator NlpD
VGRFGRFLRNTALVALSGTAAVLGLGTWYANNHPAPETSQASAQRGLASAGLQRSSLIRAGPFAPRTPQPQMLPAAYYASLRLFIPVSGIRADELVDTFSQARADGMRSHDAIDIPAALGTPVVAAADGRAEKIFVSRDGGNTVYLRSDDGQLVYYYAHLDRYAPDLAEGKMLRQGDVIGEVGYSGNANPAVPHLHFAVFEVPPGGTWYRHGAAINPYPLLARRH